MHVCMINRVPWVRASVTSWLEHSEMEDTDVVLISRYDIPDSEKRGLSKFVYFESYDDDLALEKLVIELHGERPFDRIIALSELDILRAAKLRSLLNIPGQSYFSAFLYRDKIAMKEWASLAGISVPSFTVAFDQEDIYSFVARHGFPIIIKPKNEYGSKNVSLISDKGELQSFCRVLDFNDGLDVESFIQGNLYHVDGIISNGRLVFTSVSMYLNSSGKSTTLFNEDIKPQFPLSTVADLQISPFSTPFKVLTNETRKLLADPKFDNGSIHAEWILDESMKPYFIEIASRTGGLLISDAIQRKYGFIMNEESFRVQLGLPFCASCVTDKLYGYLSILPKRGRIDKYDINTIANNSNVISFSTSYKSGDYIDAQSESTDNIGLLLFEIDQRKTLLEQVEYWTLFLNSKIHVLSD